MQNQEGFGLASNTQAVNPLIEVFWNAVAFLQQGRLSEAYVLFTEILRQNPNHFDALHLSGVIAYHSRQFDEAEAFYVRAMRINQNFAPLHSNRGVALHELKRFDEALASYDKAISIKPDHGEAFNNRGATLHELKRFDEALASYDKAIAIKPDFEWIFGLWLNLRLKTSEWLNLERILSELKTNIQNGKNVTPPLPVLSLFDDLELSMIAARQWVEKKYKFNTLAATFENRGVKEKIRIGYFSANFYNHPVAYLMAELFEQHDRNQFEIFAFSFGPDHVDEMRRRLEVSFDKFIDVRLKSDQEVAELSRSLGIDIAVDLMGFTQDSRTHIFAYRCAPIQVNYMGYPGTMSADYIDYIVADPTLIPPESQRFYSEKVVYMPDSYQVNDSKREISSREFTRTELGLPEEGFVFCCFNNSYKILPDVFESWMRILKAVDGSVLWLSGDNETSTRNLRREVSNRGISPDRLVFSKKMPSLADHLARHRSADLFLDTLPYNAHTTASDALWAGLPVLTRIGQSFAARVAASLLKAVGLPELVTTSVEDYEQLAIKLATHPDEMKALKQKLADNRLSSTLFDTPLFARGLETAYASMYQRFQDGLEPDHINVGALR